MKLMAKDFLMYLFLVDIFRKYFFKALKIIAKIFVKLSLEDDYRRLQERLYRLFGIESADDLFFSVYASQTGKGLDEQFARFVAEHKDTTLIIIDTLQKGRERECEWWDYLSIGKIIWWGKAKNSLLFTLRWNLEVV